MVTAGAVPQCSPEVEALLAATAERLLGELDEVADLLIERVEQVMPHIRLGDEFHASLISVARSSAQLLSTMIRSWTPPQVVPPPHDALIWARGLVGRGIPMDDLLRIYRLGQAAYQDLFYADLVAGDHDPALVTDAMRACSAFAFAWIDAISAPLIEAYQQERDRRRRGAAAVRTEAITALLNGAPVDVDVTSARLGYDLRRTHCCVLLWTTDERAADLPGDPVDDAVRHVAEALGGHGRPLVHHDGVDECAAWVACDVVPPDAAERVARRLRNARFRVALSGAAPGVDGFRLAHREARRARRVGRLLRRAARATAYHDVAVEDLLLRDVEAARQVAASILGPLAAGDDASRRLLETLRVYLEEGQSLARAARRLGIHQNTIAYRIRRAASIAGQEEPGAKALQAAVLLAPLLNDEPVIDPEAPRLDPR